MHDTSTVDARYEQTKMHNANGKRMMHVLGTMLIPSDETSTGTDRAIMACDTV